MNPFLSKTYDQPRRRQWHPTPVLLPGKSHRWRSVVGCGPWGREESDMTEWLHFHFSLSCIGEGNGNPLQCSCLENLRDRGAWWAAVHGIAQSRTRLKWLSSRHHWVTFTFHFLSVYAAHMGSGPTQLPPGLRSLCAVQRVSLFLGTTWEALSWQGIEGWAPAHREPGFAVSKNALAARIGKLECMKHRPPPFAESSCFDHAMTMVWPCFDPCRGKDLFPWSVF